MKTHTLIVKPNETSQNLHNMTSTSSKTTSKIEIKSDRINLKLTKISNKIKPETAVFTLIKLLFEHHDQINIVNSVLTINSEDLDLVQKLNYCMEFLAHIPFTFRYDKMNMRVLLDFFHLEEDVNLINNMEFQTKH